MHPDSLSVETLLIVNDSPWGSSLPLTALRFAEALNSNPPGIVDSESKLHQQFQKMQHPDLTVIQRQPGDRSLKIEAVRQLQHTLSLAPYIANYRIALLLNFDEANPNAASTVLRMIRTSAR